MTEAYDLDIDIVATAPVAAHEASVSYAWNWQALTARVIAALRAVYDPEIPVNIYDLGLVYRIEARDAGSIEIDMTLTAPGCPVAGEMLGSVEKAVGEVDGVDRVTVNLVFDPPWDMSRMADEAKLELGFL